MISKLDHFQKILEEEKDKLEAMLQKVARRNPENPDDWQPVLPRTQEGISDKNEYADKFEDFENILSTEIQLESRLNNVKDALKRIEEGVFGQCRVCGKEIGEKRLEANPAAKTCVNHLDKNQ